MEAFNSVELRSKLSKKEKKRDNRVQKAKGMIPKTQK